MGYPDVKWTPPEDAVPVKQAWTPPVDAVPVQKKNPIGNAAPNGLPPSNGGFNPFPASQSQPFSAVAATPQMQQQLQAQGQQQVQQDNAKQQAQSDALKPYWDSLSPDEQKALDQGSRQVIAQHDNQSLTATSQQEQGDYAYSQTLPGKIQNAVTYLAQKATKGGLQVAKGAAYLYNLGANAQMGKLSGDSKQTDEVFKSADEATNFLPKGSEARVEDSNVMKNLGGLAEFLPAAAAASSTGGATLYLQGLGQGKETMDNAEANGAKINPTVKTAFILGSGAVNGFLMGDLGHGIFNSLGSSLKDDIVKNITMNAIKEAAGKDITAEGFTSLLQQGAKDWGDKALQGGVNFLKSTKKAVTDLSLLNIGNFALKKGVDATNDTPVFPNENLGTLAQQEGETLKSAPLFGLAGSVGDVSKLTPFSEYKNAVVDNLLHDSSDANVANTKQFISQHGAEQGWSPDEIQTTNNHIDDLAGITKSIPKNLPPEKGSQAVDLIIGRNTLQKELQQAQTERQGLTTPFNAEPSQGETLLQDKIDQANDKLRALVSGNRPTYSKGTEANGEDGTFFKTTGGVKEEIPQSRYDLEVMERDAKVKQQADELGDKIGLTPENVANDIISKSNEAIQANQAPAEVPVEAPKEDDAGNKATPDKATDENGGDKTIDNFKLGDQDEFYHASPTKREGPLQEGEAPQFGKGTYFSTNKDLVINEFGKELTKVNLKLEKPLYTGTKEEGDVLKRAADNWNRDNLTWDKENEEWVDKSGKSKADYPLTGTDLGEKLPVKYFSDAAKEMGYDAIIDKNSHAYDNEIVVLDPKKIVYKDEQKENSQIKQQSNAVSEQTTGEMGVRNGETVGEGVGGQDQPKGVTAESKPADVSSENVQQKEVSNTVLAKTADIKSDPKQFQPRGTDFSEASTDKIVNNFDDNKLDPIVTYNHDGKDYVLSGHSRLEAHKRLDALPDDNPIKQKAIENGFQQGKIKAREFNGTLEQAKEFADRSNDLANKNKDYESANSIRKMREAGKSQKEINERAAQDFGKDAEYIKALSYLNPKGEVVNALKQLGETGDKATRVQLEKIASWIGTARQRIPELTDSHEREMFNFLNDKKNDNITTKADFVSKISALVNSLHFKADEPLNLNRIKETNSGREAYDRDYADLSQKVKDKEAEIEALKDRLNNPKNADYIKPGSPDYDATVKYAEKVKDKKGEELKILRRNLLDLAQKKSWYQAEGMNQRGIFDAVDNTPVKPIGDVSTKDKAEINKAIERHDINVDQIKDYEQSRTTGTPESDTEQPERTSETVQQPENEQQGSTSENTQGKGAPSEEKPTVEPTATTTERGTDGNTTAGSDGERTGGISDKAKELADKIRSLKSDKNVLHGGLEGVATAVWDGALETVATVIEKGGELADAINEGVKHILNAHPDLDKDEVRKKLDDDINGVSEEPKEEPIGISRAETKKQREMRGLEDLPEAQRVTLSDMFDDGKKAIEEKEIDPSKLAIEVADKPRNLTPTEVNALLYDRQSIREGLEDVRALMANKIADTDSSPESMELIQDRQRFLENQLDTNERALRSGARQNSLALNAMKSMINADYTLAEQRARMRTAAGGELTPAMEAELEKYKAERDKAVKDLEDYQQKQKENDLQKQIAVEQRKANKSITKEALKNERKSIVEDFRAELKKMRESGALNSVGKASVEFLQAATPFMHKMLTNLVKEGIVEAKDIVAKIREEFKDDIDGLTDRDVMDALSGRYNKKGETKNDLILQRQSIVRTLNLTTRLEDLKNRTEPEKTERKQVQKNKEISDLEQQIKDEKKKISFETAEDRSKESMRKKLDRINAQIEDMKKGVMPTKETRPIVNTDAESITLQAKVKKAENNFDAMAERLNAHTKNPLEKTLNTIQQIRRAMLLSGMKTLGKLYSFAVARSISTPIEEVVNSINSKIPGLNKIAEQSPRFSQGLNYRAEAQAITTRWSKATLGDSWKDVLSTGVGELDRLYGKSGVDKDFDLNPSPLELFGRLHGAFKNSTKRAEFFRSFQKRLEFAAKNGQDINDPNVQFVAGLDAYADGKRAILMNDNLLVDKGYKSLLRGLEQSDKLNKNNTGKVIAAVIRGVFPIVKIPTNYVLESLDVATFGVRAIPNLIKAISKGADSLTPKEADMVMRTLAKGQVGLGLMIYAYFNPQMFGGYYSGERKGKDLGSGDIKMFGHVLPHFLSHNPYFEAMQIAATFRRAIDKARHTKESGIATGAKQAAKGVTEQIPFTGLSDILGDKNASAGDVAGKAVKNLIEPRLMQEGAELTDKKTNDKTTRKPKGFVQQLESGVPVLREKVPLKKKKKY